MATCFIKKSDYRIIAKKGEGTFSEVLKAQCLKTNKFVAIKCMKNTFDSLEQVTNLREIQALQRLSPHANIIKLLEVLFDESAGKLALVFELMDMNIYELIRGRRTYVSEERIKLYMYQLMKAVDHMHRNGIFHRDIKPENILISDEVLKLADFGSCRGVYSKQPYTEYISTRWYRPPECLLTDGYYGHKMDMWGIGCVFFEIISLFPLFPGVNELDQIQKIHKILGTPPAAVLEKLRRRSKHADYNFPQQDGSGIARLIPHASPACIELLSKLLAYSPEDRWSARQALRHVYFKELRDKEKLQERLQQSVQSVTTRSLYSSLKLEKSPWDPETEKISHKISASHDFKDVSISKHRASDSALKTTLIDRSSSFGSVSATTSPHSMAGPSQIPILSSWSKPKEHEKGPLRSPPNPHGTDMLSPSPMYATQSVGSSLSMYAAQAESRNTFRGSDDGNNDGCYALPPIKESHHHPMILPKITLTHSGNLHGPHSTSTSKISIPKHFKTIKGVKNNRSMLLDLSPKSCTGVPKAGEPPPYKKRANNKYISPYSQRYLRQSPYIT